MTDDTPLELEWSLRGRMKQARIASVAELHRRLGTDRVLISQVQLGRLVQEVPTRLNLSVLAALCRVLDCAPGDLLHWRTCADSTAPTRRRPRRKVLSSDDMQRMIGPRFHLRSKGDET
ncbi:helix-turn-helix domain-containing protein [Lysobacter capsici]|uniref:helix-turn-helix domain-containing protein n=1 Tax=Lysobacter capsici TaxID=435897 RepID=UPI00287B81EA|nr:helix-turn-helix transcriptional regulator [Lysobacter capsici]WND81132.1 helix-turn-helix transcriptional regulator [Lysobacter capsici]WND86328.1 helix-turn-helix transcriptional regulator [Lysobacter capsici]